ncbi:MAG: hypothetical protein JWR21_1342 [Herminiimonas sp.]|nr:hypothetical protein [Herminiimonas sp.]MDB5852618.1 hypothetical protein [Herminiimonas sp.]
MLVAFPATMRLHSMQRSQAYAHKSNATTLLRFFGTDILNPEPQRDHEAQTRRVLPRILELPPPWSLAAVRGPRAGATDKYYVYSACCKSKVWLAAGAREFLDCSVDEQPGRWFQWFLSTVKQESA